MFTELGKSTTVPTINVPDPTCCNVAGALCSRCQRKARTPREAGGVANCDDDDDVAMMSGDVPKRRQDADAATANANAERDYLAGLWGAELNGDAVPVQNRGQPWFFGGRHTPSGAVMNSAEDRQDIEDMTAER